MKRKSTNFPIEDIELSLKVPKLEPREFAEALQKSDGEFGACANDAELGKTSESPSQSGAYSSGQNHYDKSSHATRDPDLRGLFEVPLRSYASCDWSRDNWIPVDSRSARTTEREGSPVQDAMANLRRAVDRKCELTKEQAQDELTYLKKESVKWKEEAVAGRKKLVQARVELEAERKNIVQVEVELFTEKTDLIRVQHELATAEHRAIRFQSELVVRKEELVVQKEKLVCLQGELATEKEKLECLQGELATEKEKLECLQGELATEKEKLECLQGELATEKEKLDCVQGELATEKEKLECIQGELATKKEKLVCLQGELATEKEKSKVSTEITGRLLTQIQGLEFKLREAEVKIEDQTEKTFCQICFERPRNAMCLPCMHSMFCIPCLEQHLKAGKTCPTCRVPAKGVLECFGLV